MAHSLNLLLSLNVIRFLLLLTMAHDDSFGVHVTILIMNHYMPMLQSRTLIHSSLMLPSLFMVKLVDIVTNMKLGSFLFPVTIPPIDSLLL